MFALGLVHDSRHEVLHRLECNARPYGRPGDTAMYRITSYLHRPHDAATGINALAPTLQ